MRSNQYDTLSQAVEDLKARGFTHEFSYSDNCLTCNTLAKTFGAGELKIKEFHRFEGPSSEDDSSVVYAIEASSGEKGMLIDAFGTYADPDKTAFILKLQDDRQT
ncbi:MAG: phosphoribosylpyrophosphate synthetase [Chitinophagales bacterium]|nr:phosphoribosylpyrophosphate synthetase [Chitinophagales bacterium]